MRALAPEVHLFHALRRTQLPKEMALQFVQLCPRDPTDTKHANALAITLHRARTRTPTPVIRTPDGSYRRSHWLFPERKREHAIDQAAEYSWNHSVRINVIRNFSSEHSICGKTQCHQEYG